MARTGEYISNLSGEAEYKSFRPTPLPIEINIDTEMLSLLTEATKALATLDTLSSYIPNMELFVSMLYFNGFDEKHKTKDILIENLCWNDTPITELDKNRFVLGKFTENIRLKASEKTV